MPSAVVDASALVELLIGGPAATAVFERVFRARVEIHAPHSVDVEVANAVRKLWRRGLLVDQDVEEIGAIYRDLKIERHGNGPFSIGSGVCATTSHRTTRRTSRSRSGWTFRSSRA